jgi:menaquinone-dependent protoporphyrinogen IX oxidase
MSKVLIAYFTKTGTTKSYAEELAAALSTAGHQVDVKQLADIGSLDGYGAAVIGAPINGMQLVPEVVNVINEHRATLRTIKTAVFAVSYMYGQARPLWSRVMEKSIAKAATLAGASSWHVFSGRVSGPLPGPMSFIFGVPKDLPLDRRDPQAIRIWAKELAATFRD